MVASLFSFLPSFLWHFRTLDLVDSDFAAFAPRYMCGRAYRQVINMYPHMVLKISTEVTTVYVLVGCERAL